LLACVAATAVALTSVLAAVTTTAAQAAVTTPTIPLVFKNNSGRSGPLFIYNLGILLATGQQGWADVNGGFHPWPAGGNPPTPAPDASIVGPASGGTLNMRIPKFSGRIYFSYGQKLVFKVTTGGLVQPAVQNPSDPNVNILFNWSEYTLNNDGLWLNSTQVDMFSAPYSVGVTTGAGATINTGRLKPGGYNQFYANLRGQPGWERLIRNGPDGQPLRALAPGHGLAGGFISPTAMQNYIDRVWARYATTTMTITPFGDQPNLRYTGRVSGNSWTFTGPGGSTTFQKPDSDSIWGCYKLLDAPNDLVRGPISRTLCAGFNRTTLLTSANQPFNQPSSFYLDQFTNHYSRKIHAQMVDGKAYGFAFDDVGNNESLVHDGSPRTAFITLDPFN
jgi:hypothetical protein